MRKVTLAILLTLFVSTVRADDAPKGDKPMGDKAGDKAAPAPAPPRKFVTRHRFTADGVDLPYTATAEDIDLKDRDGKPTARFFTISYTAEGVKRQEDRPITFFFNGGSGSASVFLHLGFVGPKRIYYATAFSGIMRGINLAALSFDGGKPFPFESIPLLPEPLETAWVEDATNQLALS